jgi:hypothetical protein
MQCLYASCPNPADETAEPVLTCSVDPGHEAHLICWARLTASMLYQGEEGRCPSAYCTGVASRPDMPDPADVLMLLLETMSDSGLHSHVVDTSTFDTDQFFNDSDDEAEPERKRQRRGDEEPALFPLDQMVTQCSSCLDDLALNDQQTDYAPEAAWWCSGGVDIQRAVYCKACADQVVCCTICQCFAFGPASRLTAPAPQLHSHVYAYEIASRRGSGKPQEGMLCYAASAATALLWNTGTDLSIYECMHLYLMSDQAADNNGVVTWYRDAFTQVVTSPGYGGLNPGEILDKVFRADPSYVDLMATVMSEMGSPVFPSGTPVRLHSPRISTADLVAAVTSDKAVIKGEGPHWTVIFGVMGPSQNSIVGVTVYDPMYDSYRAESWSPNVDADYYVVS